MSDTPNQPNSIPNSNPTNPNLNPANPNSNSTNSNPPTTPSTQTNVAFRSEAIGKQTARPQDYFAEQNQKTAAKKENQSRQTKRILIIIGIILGVLLIVGLIWFIVAKISQPNPDEQPSDEPTEITEVERNQALAQEIYNAATKDAQNTEESRENDQAAAAEIFQQAINDAANETDANIIRISEMAYLLDQGEYYKVLQTGNEGKICRDMSLDVNTRIECANIISNAAYERDDIALSEEYRNLALQYIDEMIVTIYPEGGKDEIEEAE